MAELAERPVPWGGGLLSRATFYRTYSRNNEETNFKQEHWHNVVQRCIEGVFDIRRSWYKIIGRNWPEYDMQNLAQNMANYMFHMRFLPPGRGLYAMGTNQVRTRGNAALNNCAFVQVGSRRGDFGHAANWMTQHLMLGVGVGFRIPEGGVGYRIHRRDSLISTYRIDDSREGWADSVQVLLDSYEGGNNYEFDYSQVRPAGSPIKTFGGISAGPEPLKRAHTQIRKLMDEAVIDHGFIDTELVADVMNILGVCVIAGNVRRSAEIAVGSPDDTTFIHMKDIGHDEKMPEGTKLWVPGEYAHRAGHSYMSNNSVWLDADTDFERIPDLVSHIVGLEGRGEPGFINGRNIRTRGRYRDKVGNGNAWLREDIATGMNPCGEIPLESHELCNLVELFPTRCSSYSEWMDAVWLATWYASTVSLLPSHDEDTNAIVSRNRRIGVSVTGVADWVDSTPFSIIHRWLDDGYDLVREVNAELAKEAGVPASIRVTTVKPSGTVSLLPWVSPGVHHLVQSRFIRRVTVKRDSPVAEHLIRGRVPHEPLLTDPDGSWSFQFPMQSGMGGRTRSLKNVSIWEQASLAAFMARVWADNAVSFTGTVGQHELKQLEAVATQFLPVVKSLSFLVDNDETEIYPQAPYEGITVAEYDRRMAEIDHDTSFDDYFGTDGEDTKFCDAEACEVDFG
jgi:ribonucleoside-diphosphate reductase alpha chain